MSAELIAILAVGVTLGVPLWAAMRDLRRDINALRASMAQEIGELRDRMTQDIGELRERMARLEGLFEGYAGVRPQKAAPA